MRSWGSEMDRSHGGAGRHVGWPFAVLHDDKYPRRYHICCFRKAASALGLGPEDFPRPMPSLATFVDAQQAILLLNYLAYGPNPALAVSCLHGAV